MLRWRWVVLLSGVTLLALLPSVVAAAPVPSSAVSAPALLHRILASAAVPYSGYAESAGGLALPVSGQFNSLTELLGGHTQQRVWWRSAQDFRVDAITTTGETDIHRTPAGDVTWDYESGRVTVTDEPAARIRLPEAADLLPPLLGRRVLGGATAAEVARLPARRVAGRDALGLRLRPSAAEASVAHVDVWADAATGVPLQVELFGRSGPPAMTAGFLDFSAAKPPTSDVAFTAPPGAPLGESRRIDLVRLIDLLSAVTLPKSLGFATRNDTVLGAGSIGVYGRGVTEFAVLQLPDRTVDTLRRQLAPTLVGAPPRRISMAIGPLSLVLTAPDGDGHTWLLVGTVTVAGLGQAADDLARRRSSR